MNWSRLWDGAIFFGLGAAIVGIIVWIFILATN
jgi:hypothetical protein